MTWLLLPTIDPILLQIGPVGIRWYGLSYLLGFLGAWVLAIKRRHTINLTQDALSDLIFYIALGIILGGRVGYVLFYDWQLIWTSPWELFLFWKPGRSFHGGLLGVVLALWVFSRKYQRPLWQIGDFIAPMIPLGIGFGRLGNFFNQELWGRVTDVPWAVVYPYLDTLPRHPSQLYESVLEGFLLCFFLWQYSKQPRTPWAVTAWFLIGYGCMRFICEWFREPDEHLGFIGFDWLTMGQLLTLPMIIVGLLLLKRQTRDGTCKLT
jgi:phosphatidylglycerol:prolipoprotein diacylglycerol transferase